MKLLRYGEVGSERPGLLDADGTIRDLSAHVADIAGFHAELMAKDYRRAKPGLQEKPWGTREVSVIDPFGNRLHFHEEIEAG